MDAFPPQIGFFKNKDSGEMCTRQVNVKIITHSGGKFGDAWGVWGGGG